MNYHQDEKDANRAKKYLNRLLSFRPRSEKEVEERLRRKGFTSRIISEVLHCAKEKNLLDDRRFAELFVANRLSRKPKGKFALTRELRDKGVDEDIIQKTLDREFEGLDVREMIKNLAEKRLKRYQREDKQSQYRKTTNFLKRRGFPPSDIYDIVRKLIYHQSSKP